VKMKEAELVIVGAGPGGLAAAIEAAKLGVKGILLDENINMGGQIHHQLEKGFRVTNKELLGRDHHTGQKLLSKVIALSDKVECLNDALVWGLFDDGDVAFRHSGTSSSLKYKRLIVAVGAYDRPVPFPGWTLPGVFTAGGAQRLVKTQGILPGERILLAGTGPLQLVLANQIISSGGKIEAILEAGNITNWLQFIAGIWNQWKILLDGSHYLSHLFKAGIPLLRNHLILEAHGNKQVEEALIADVDKDWRPKPETKRTIQVDAICIGYGLVPSNELTLLAGCEHRYEPLLGGWVPLRGETMETSLEHVYAVGDGSGVAGSQVAVEEGRIAGICVAHSLGYISEQEFKRRVQPFQRRLKKLTRMRRVLDEISRPRVGLFELAQDDTIICRCEEVTLGEIREAINRGATDVNEVKSMTRAGMGRCQGRMCGPALIEIINRQQASHTTQPSYFRRRPPVKPVPLVEIAKHSKLEGRFKKIV